MGFNQAVPSYII